MQPSTPPATRARPGTAGLLLAGLTPAQREAVLADDAVVCVLAGAGAGKTRVLTLRVARRAADRSGHPSHVLVCTFSRRAADELGDRLWGLGVGSEVIAGTFHRTALRLIRQHFADLGRSAPALLADRRPLVAEVAAQLTAEVRAAPTGPGRSDRATAAGGLAQAWPSGQWEPRSGQWEPRSGQWEPRSGQWEPRSGQWEPRSGPRGRGRAARAAGSGTPRAPRSAATRLEAEIGWAKARLVRPEEYEAAAEAAGRRVGMAPAQVADAYARYETLRRRRGVLDMDDLLWTAGDLLEDARFAAAVRWRHRHVYVDEMQDLNEAQFRLLRLLAGDDPDLFVVGDPNQSVYGWNGADPGLLDRIPDVFDGTRVLRLDANHRCSPQVVRAAAAVLAGGQGRRRLQGADADPGGPGGRRPGHARSDGAAAHDASGPRATRPVSTRPDGSIPRVVRLDTDEAEAAWVARQVWLAHRPGRRWSQIAVLARTNAQLDRMAAALDRERVPYRMAGAELGPASDVSAAALAPAWEPGTGTGAGTDDDDDPDPPRDSVVLSTFHRAKGLEWPVVFVTGLADGLVPVAGARSGEAREEERRLLYVALTRAEDELTCTWPGQTTARNGEPGTLRRPSPWLAAVEAVVAELASESAGAEPTRAARHLAEIRARLEASGGGGAPGSGPGPGAGDPGG